MAARQLARIVRDWTLSQKTRTAAADEQIKRGMLQCRYMHKAQRCDLEQDHTGMCCVVRSKGN